MARQKQFVHGVAWRAAGQMARQASTFLFGIALARQLGPEAFGIVAMAMVLVGFLTILDDLGIGPALVRLREFGDVERSTALWFSLPYGTALGLACAALGLPLAHFYREPSLVPIVAALSTTFPLAALGMVQRVELLRNLRFRTLARIDLVGALIGGSIGVACAFNGAGAWSLVAQTVGGAFANCLQLWLTVRWRPRLVFQRAALKGLVKFGVNLMATDVVSFASRNIDNLLIGRFYGAMPLALYARSYSFLVLFLYGVRTVTKVLYPTLAGIQDDLARVRAQFLRVTGVLAIVTWPGALGLAVVADPFVRTIFGDRWLGMIPLLRLLAPIAIWQSIAALQGPLFQICGRTDLQLRNALMMNAICIAGIVAGVPWGAEGVATGYLCATAFAYPLGLRSALKLAGLTLGDVLRQVRGVAGCCCITALSAGAALMAVPGSYPSWTRLGVAVAAGAAAFFASASALRPRAWQDMLIAARTLRGPATA